MKQSKYDQFLQTYSGQQLLKQYSLNEVGVWKVQGEDPNCDLHGPHHQPELGMFEGKLDDIVHHAVELSNFWEWGGGGSITRVGKPVKIDSLTNERRILLKDQKEKLEAALKEVNAQLKGLV